MRICVAAALMADHRFRITGTPRIAHELAIHLTDKGHDVFAITDRVSSPDAAAQRPYLVETIGSHFSLDSLSRFAKLVSQKCDVIHIHGGEQMSYYARLLGLLTPIPIVFTFTFAPSVFRKSMPLSTQFMLAWLSKARGAVSSIDQIDHSIALSEFAKKRLILDESLALEDVSVVKYGISDDYLEANCEENAVPRLVAYTGGPDEERGVTDFIRAAHAVHASHPEVRFVVMARDSMEFQRLQSICPTGIEVWRPNYLLGAVKLTSLVVMPFRKHVAIDPPLSLLECMALGKAIVSTPVGSIPEILGNDRGWIVSQNSPDEIAKVESSLLDDDALRTRISLAAKEYSRSNYQWDKAVSSIVSIYHKVRN